MAARIAGQLIIVDMPRTRRPRVERVPARVVQIIGVQLSFFDRTEGDRWWIRHAGCAGLDTNLFYPTIDEETSPIGAVKWAAAARSVCFQCPVRVVCGEAAIARRERHGIWGAMTYEERRVIINKRELPRTVNGALNYANRHRFGRELASAGNKGYQNGKPRPSS